MGNKEEKAWSSNSKKDEKEKEEEATQPAPLKLQKENVVQKIAVGETEETADLKGKKETGSKWTWDRPLGVVLMMRRGTT